MCRVLRCVCIGYVYRSVVVVVIGELANHSYLIDYRGG